MDCEDGYALDKCIPLPGTDDGWTGVYGRIVMLSTNSMRLRQDPTTRSWYVDQTALAARPRGQDFQQVRVVCCFSCLGLLLKFSNEVY